MSRISGQEFIYSPALVNPLFFFLLSDINTIKNQINSLLYVIKVCDSRIQRLQSGKVSILE